MTGPLKYSEENPKPQEVFGCLSGIRTIFGSPFASQSPFPLPALAGLGYSTFRCALNGTTWGVAGWNGLGMRHAVISWIYLPRAPWFSLGFSSPALFARDWIGKPHHDGLSPSGLPIRGRLFSLQGGWWLEGVGPLDFHDFFLEFPGVSKVVRGSRQVQPSLKRKIP